MKFGYKINGDWASQAYPIAGQLPVSVVVNNMALARSLKNSGKFVIHRFTHLNGVQDEGFNDFHKSIGAIEYANRLAQAHGLNNRDIWLYVFNEPSIGNPTDMLTFITYAIATFTRLKELGFSVVGLNTPPASYPSEWVNSGVYDPLINYAHNNKTSFILGFHDYSDLSLVRFGNADAKDYSQMDNRAYVAPANWSIAVNPPTAWHIFHITRLLVRAREQGKRIRLGCTELGFSEMPDTANLPDVRRINAKYPKTPVNAPTLNGQHTLHAYWQDMYPNWSWEQVVMEQLKWYSRLAWSEIEFATLYAFGFGGGAGQDFWNDNEFHRQFIAWQKVGGTPPQPPVTPPPANVVYLTSTGNATRIRTAPSVLAKIIGNVTRSTPAVLLSTANGWHKIVWQGKIGYCYAQFVKVSNSPV